MKRMLHIMRETALLMVGQPRYETYLQHMAERHPDREPMTRTAFFREREQARYGSGAGKCC